MFSCEGIRLAAGVRVAQTPVALEEVLAVGRGDEGVSVAVTLVLVGVLSDCVPRGAAKVKGRDCVLAGRCRCGCARFGRGDYDSRCRLCDFADTIGF